jgi:hypothetical protein
MQVVYSWAARVSCWRLQQSVSDTHRVEGFTEWLTASHPLSKAWPLGFLCMHLWARLVHLSPIIL